MTHHGGRYCRRAITQTSLSALYTGTAARPVCAIYRYCSEACLRFEVSVPLPPSAYSIRAFLRRATTLVLLHPCTAAPLHLCTAAPLHRCILHRCTAAPLHRCTAASLHRCTAAPLHRCIAASLHHCIAASLHRCTAASLHRCIAAPPLTHFGWARGLQHGEGRASFRVARPPIAATDSSATAIAFSLFHDATVAIGVPQLRLCTDVYEHVYSHTYHHARTRACLHARTHAHACARTHARTHMHEVCEGR